MSHTSDRRSEHRSEHRSVISFHHSDRESEQETLRVVRDTICQSLIDQRNLIEERMLERPNCTAIATLKVQMLKLLDDLRQAHLDLVSSCKRVARPIGDAYEYISEVELMVRETSERVELYIESNPSPRRSVDVESITASSQYESFDFDRHDRPDRRPLLLNNMRSILSSHEVHTSSESHSPYRNEHFDRSFEFPSDHRKIGHSSGPVHHSHPKGDLKFESNSMKDWIDRREPPVNNTPSGSFNPGWLMHSLPQFKIEIFKGDPREWPTFITSFRDMVHDVVPTVAQRHAILKQLLSTEVRSYIAEFLESPATYYDALSELKRRYGQPQVVARSHLTALMTLPVIKDDDFKELAKLSRTLHGAMHALRVGGYEQDLESGMSLEHVVSKLPPRMRHTWGVKVYRMTPRRATLTDLAKWLDEFVMGDMMTRPVQSNSKSVKFKDYKEKQANRSTPPLIFATDSSASSSSNEKKPCSFCKNSHDISKCFSFKRLDASARIEWAKEQKLCFRCLKGQHRSSECNSRYVCDINNCGRKHHSLLHGSPRAFPPKAETDSTPVPAPAPSPGILKNDGQVCAINQASTLITTFLNIVPVIVQANGKQVTTHALLDNGSNTSLIRSDVANVLGLKGPERQVTFGTFHGSDPKVSSMKVNFSLKSLDGSFVLKIDRASTVPVLNLSRKKVNFDEVRRQWPHLKDVQPNLADYGDITILIGAEKQRAHLQLDVRVPPEDNDNAPFGILTPFGWCFSGPLPVPNDESNLLVNVCCDPDDECDLEQRVEKFWTTESFPVMLNLKSIESANDKLAREIVEKSLTRLKEKFVSGLPWASINVRLPDNMEAALRRLLAIEYRFRRDPVYAAKYQAVIEEFIHKGFARPLRASELNGPPGRTWLLPHHGVVNPRKPDKVRVVFDASCRFKGISLNDVLLKGPNLLLDIIDVILLFREKAVAISGDIKQMFLQVGVSEQDQPALRFLWRPPGSRNPPTVYQMLVQIFGAISSPFICSFVLRKNAEEHKVEFPMVAERVSTNFYVDNLLDSFDTEGEAIQAVKDYTELLRRGGFHLNQWTSSSRRVLSTIPAEDWSQPTLNLDLDNLPIERTLGVLYDSESDAFLFKICLAPDAQTKRKILSVVASLYDPVGFLAPVILTAKKILQDLWASGVDWDEQAPSVILECWRNWVAELSLLESLKIPRALTQSQKITSIQLHVCCDASTIGFGAVVYLRTVYDNSSVNVSLIIAKSRVAPLKPLTIPRLELQGAVIAVRLAKSIKSGLRLTVDNVYFWCDSTTVLQWIKSKTCKFHTFVANRVAEILEESNPSQWRHIPGVENPADEVSRGMTPFEFVQNQRWINGPAFLKEIDENSWPDGPEIAEPPSHDPEIAPVKWVGSVIDEVEENRFRQVMCKTSKFLHCRRIIALVLRFIHNLKARKLQVPRQTGLLTASDLKQALIVCVQQAQGECFGDEVKLLKASNPIGKNSHLIKLTPLIDDDGVLRVGGRLDRGDFVYNVAHPTILPKTHPLTQLIVLEEHEKLRHPSTERLLSSLRSLFWIIGGRNVIRRFTSHCFICRRLRATPESPIMAALPRHRLQPFQPPFTNTGLDYFGPYPVVRGRGTEKRYVLLCTCLVTRAVHLEIAYSLDTNSFLMAFQRFENRRGRPAVVYSDNGTQIVAGDKEIAECLANWNQVKIAGMMSKNSIEWHFSPPAAPHFGGVWESLVKSAKIALNSVMFIRSVSDEMLQTMMVEVESLLNGRPLTHVSVDPRDPEPLTPNHFLLGRAAPNIPADRFEEMDITSRKTWRVVQALTNQFWHRWLKEYLPSVIERRKWMQPRPNLQTDDIVLVISPNTPRGHWPIGRVIQPIPSADGVVRSAVIRTSSGEYVRPVVKLCLLEKDVFDESKTGPAVTDGPSA